MYNSFELFFFWRKCSTVVAVGVQTSFLPVGGLAYWFFWGTIKSNVPKKRGLQKVWQKKTTAGLIARRQAKRLCKPRGTRGEDFRLPGILPGGASCNELSGNAWPLSALKFIRIWLYFDEFTKEVALIHQHPVICFWIALEVLKQIYMWRLPLVYSYPEKHIQLYFVFAIYKG